MLIKVFDRWINPNAITNIDPSGNDARVYLGGIACSRNGDTVYDSMLYLAKGVDEVAEEINRQIADSNKITTGG